METHEISDAKFNSCIICTETCQFYGEYDCKHLICGRCACKYVFLYKDLKCAQCNKLSNKIIINSNSNIDEYRDIKIDERVHNDLIIYNNEESMRFVSYLLQHKCRICQFVCKNSIDLQKHFKLNHPNKFICKTCVDRNFTFWDELSIYTYIEYKTHKKKRHEYCVFCEKNFFDLKALKEHSTQKHQICSICCVLGKNNIYLNNFEDLQKHYQSEHWCCKDKICRNNHCYVYAHKSELWAHYQQIHKIQSNFDELEIRISVEKPRKMAVGGNGVEMTIFNSAPRITNPVVGERHYPEFGSDTLASRVLARTENGANYSKIKSCVNFITNSNVTELSKEIFEIIKVTEKLTKEVTDDLEEIMASFLPTKTFTERKRVIHNILEGVYGLKERDFIEKYYNEVKYPGFNKVELKTNEKSETIDIKKNRFKVIDISKLKKK